MNIFLDSNLGTAFKELFNDTVSATKDVVTLPVRALKAGNSMLPFNVLSGSIVTIFPLGFGCSTAESIAIGIATTYGLEMLCARDENVPIIQGHEPS